MTIPLIFAFAGLLALFLQTTIWMNSPPGYALWTSKLFAT
jgi:hypothetical protein